MKKQQQKIEMILDAKKIPYNKLDIAADEGLKKKMRELAGDPKALPPQLCNGDQYCGVSSEYSAPCMPPPTELNIKLQSLRLYYWRLSGPTS